MTASDIAALLACVGQLAIAVLAITLATRSPLAIPLALLCLDIAAWTAAGLARHLSGNSLWQWLDHALTPWTAPLALQFALAFIGRRRALRATLVVAFVACGGPCVAPLLAFVMPAVRPFVGSDLWAASILATSIPTMAFATVVLVRHLHASVDGAERARTRILLAAFAVGTAFAATEELSHFVPVPRLASVGMTISSLLFALVALRLRLFERDVPVRVAVAVLVLTATAVLSALLFGHHLSATVAMALFGSSAVTLALIGASLRWLSEGADRRARRTQLATLGRFSAQMAHDLKNPLAALQGAAQLLRQDLERPTPGVDRVLFAQLMLEQIARIDRLADVYGRLARADPERQDVDLNSLVGTVLALPALTGAAGVSIETVLEPELPRCRADPNMVARLLENVVRNAMEAMPDGGTVTVRTRRSDRESEAGVALSVQDTGAGMDARTRERAFDDFFTTKPTGSGLGLAFVRRVVEAHGGEASLESARGRGTVVSVWLPALERARSEGA
jgi:signal transduction histidine kinase